MYRYKEMPLLLPVFFLGALPVMWFGIKIAPNTSGGLPFIIQELSSAMEHPFTLEFCSTTLRTVFICIIIYMTCICALMSGKNIYR